jgi:hypothetical protein
MGIIAAALMVYAHTVDASYSGLGTSRYFARNEEWKMINKISIFRIGYRLLVL